jgi:Protein of unknown function (DUF1571)
MARSTESQPRPISNRRHNLLAMLIAFVAVAVLYFNFDPTPAGGDFGGKVDLDRVTAEIALPTDGAVNGTDGNTKGSGNHSALSNRAALLFQLMLLERGIQKLDKLADHTATFYKRERVDGRMGEPQVMQIKVRHKPFSVYMTWLTGDKGRELLYVEGKYDGKMLVKLGGVKGRLVPTLKLDPNGSQAMAESRHPVTNAGLLNLAKKVADYRRKDLKQKAAVKCRLFEDQVLNDRKTYCFVIEYPNAAASKVYRKSVIFVDKEWLVPVCVQNFGWPDGSAVEAAKLDKETLLEDYRFSSIHLDQKLADSHFDRYNEKYRLRR